MELTTYIHIVLKLRMSRVITLLPHMHSCNAHRIYLATVCICAVLLQVYLEGEILLYLKHDMYCRT